MKQAKKYTQKQQLAALAKENSKTFSLLIQLSQELQFLGQRQETMLTMMKELPGYENALTLLKEKQEKAEAEKTKEEGEEKVDIIYGDEEEQRMNVIGQNGNTGEHYDA